MGHRFPAAAGQPKGRTKSLGYVPTLSTSPCHQGLGTGQEVNQQSKSDLTGAQANWPQEWSLGQLLHSPLVELRKRVLGWGKG